VWGFGHGLGGVGRGRLGGKGGLESRKLARMMGGDVTRWRASQARVRCSRCACRAARTLRHLSVQPEALWRHRRRARDLIVDRAVGLVRHLQQNAARLRHLILATRDVWIDRSISAVLHFCGMCSTRHRRGRRTGRSARRCLLLSGNEKRSARCRQLTTTGQQALDDAASSGLHAGTKSPEVLTAGRAEFSDGFTLRLRSSKLHKGLLRRSRLGKSCGRAKKRCHDEKRSSDAVCQWNAPPIIRKVSFFNKIMTLMFGFFGPALWRQKSLSECRPGVLVLFPS
jgi:hypothetical protein